MDGPSAAAGSDRPGESQPATGKSTVEADRVPNNDGKATATAQAGTSVPAAAPPFEKREPTLIAMPPSEGKDLARQASKPERTEEKAAASVVPTPAAAIPIPAPESAKAQSQLPTQQPRATPAAAASVAPGGAKEKEEHRVSASVTGAAASVSEGHSYVERSPSGHYVKVCFLSRNRWAAAVDAV